MRISFLIPLHCIRGSQRDLCPIFGCEKTAAPPAQGPARRLPQQPRSGTGGGKTKTGQKYIFSVGPAQSGGRENHPTQAQMTARSRTQRRSSMLHRVRHDDCSAAKHFSPPDGHVQTGRLDLPPGLLVAIF